MDPDDPTEAVLERTPAIGWVSLALGGLMLGFGTFMVGRLWRTRWMRRSLTGARLTEYCIGKPSADTRTFRVSPPPWMMAIVCGLGALVLSPAAAWSLKKGVRALIHGQGDILNLLYGAAAAIGSIWLLQQCGKYILRARRPTPILRLTPGVPTVGGPLQIEWKFPSSKPLQSLSIWIEGTEEAKVRHVIHGLHGVASEEKTDRSVFSKLPLVDQVSPQQFGSVSIRLPAKTMHSFRGAKCSIAWQIKVSVDGAPGKNVEYAFPINVRPIEI